MATPDVTPTGAGEERASLNLADLRQTKGLTLEEIARATRIRVHFLEAIEAEEFGALPGGVYATSYIRQYCRAIGCDEAVVLARYRAQSEPEPVGPAAAPRRRVARLHWRPRALQNLLDHVAHRGRSQDAALTGVSPAGASKLPGTFVMAKSVHARPRGRLKLVCWPLSARELRHLQFAFKLTRLCFSQVAAQPSETSTCNRAELPPFPAYDF